MSIPIRAWIGIACLLGSAGRALATDPLHTQDEAPTIVYVSAERGQLYSGPGEDFYPTGSIAQNSSLEVYHQTQDDWLGVRPPEGSFSWVHAADAYLLPGGRIIEVTNPAAVSWIGTSLGSAKQFRWQVKLTAGEQLAVLGEQTTHEADGKEVLWYKIAPPAGEFRWIAAKSVSRKPLTQRPPKATATNSQRTSQGSSAVVTAAYQGGSDEGVVVLGNPDDYYAGQAQSSGPMLIEGSYPRTPMAGEIIDGEVVVGEGYAPGEIIEGQHLRGELGEGSYEVGGYGEGRYIDEAYDSQGYVDGQVIDDSGYYDEGYGEVIQDGGDYIDGVVRSNSKGTFAGWHALELNDDGMRFTWLERLYGRAKQSGPDPLQADPFSLAMQRGQVRPASPRAIAQMYPEGIPQAEYVEATPASRRHRPWRDPRTLGNSRTGGEVGPLRAPTLSSHAAGSAGANTLAAGAAPLTAGLQRLSTALQGGTGSLIGSQTDVGQAAAGSVNWYGVGQAGAPGTPTNSQASGGVSVAAFQAAATNLDISQLQLNLSEAVAQPMQTWSLQPIYDSARYYVEHGASAVERGQARLLMERIEEFSELAARSGYLALNRSSFGGSGTGSSATTSPVMLASTSASALGGAVRSDFERAVGADASYDATGWLVPVIAASAGQPTHALTDDTGRIQAYVSPAPGLNLDRYLNQAVGISGLRGYLPQLQAGHIQASRVVRLQ